MNAGTFQGCIVLVAALGLGLILIMALRSMDS